VKEIVIRLVGILICAALCAVAVIYLWPLIASGFNLITYRILTIVAAAVMVIAIAKS